MLTVATIELIRNFIAEKIEDSIFSIRELLPFGSRSAVDRAVGRLVKCGVLVRVVRGLYIRPSGKKVDFSARQLAEAKARAFGKQVFSHGREACLSFHQASPDGAIDACFAVDGSSSSFSTGRGRIRLKQSCPKYLKYSDTPLGMAIRTLLQMRRSGSAAISQICARLKSGVPDGQFLQAAPWMPAWLSDMINFV